MQLYFVRHAQSENNLLYAQGGAFERRSADPDITPVGRQQARKLAEFLGSPGRPDLAPAYDPQNVGGFGLSHLYCSLMLRSVATGTILARALGLPLVAWTDLHEVGGVHDMISLDGDRVGLPGKNRAYFEGRFPDLLLPESLGEEGWWNRSYEEHAQRPLRARRVLCELLDRHGDSDDRVALVSHGGFFNHLLRAILELPEGTTRWFSMNNAAITRIDFEGGEAVLQYTNHVGFLPRELIT